MFADTSLKIAGLLATALLAAGAAGAATPGTPNAVAAAAGPAAPAASAGAPAATEATIGEITRLARELKVEQLKKELRDAKRDENAARQAPASVSRLPAGSFDFPGRTAANGPPVPATVMPPLPTGVSLQMQEAARAPRVPTVTAIGGMGGQLRAYLAGGRELMVGGVVPVGAATWTVRGISADSVRFDVCETQAGEVKTVRGKKVVAPAEQVCGSRSIAPSAAPAPALPTPGLPVPTGH